MTTSPEKQVERKDCIKVVVRIPCETCGASGTVYDPTGFGYRKSNHLDGEDWIRWLNEQGYSENDPLPPEEGDCDDCEGAGYRNGEMTIAELIPGLDLPSKVEVPDAH